MIIRILRPCEVAGRNVAAGLTLDLPEHEAGALVDTGAAEPLVKPAPPAPPAAAAEGE